MRRGLTLVFLLTVVAACSSTDAGTTIDTAGPSVVDTTNTSETVTSETVTSETESAPTTSTTGALPPVTPQGFDLVAATITTAEGEVCDVCLWLADTAPQRSQGLMRVTDLGAGDGMAFVYPAPHTGSFWMKNTVLPLSIAFFGDEGDYLDDFDMEPCMADPCPRYPTAPEFTVAIETTQGDLGAIGVGPGSRLVLSDVACADEP